MSENVEGFPREFLPEDPADTQLSDFRNISEYLYSRVATPSDRVQIRAFAERYRTELQADGVDLDDIDDMNLLWEGWYLSSRCWQPFLLGDLPQLSEIKRAAIRAMQWSGMVLLLTTEPNTPEPPNQETQ